MQVLVAGALLGLLGIAALSIDSGYALATRTQLQAAADAGAHAAIGELRLGVTPGQARDAGKDVANQNFVAYGGGVVTTDADVELGQWNYATRTFTASTTGVSAVRVTARREIEFFLAPLVGMASAELSASSVAALGQRDVVLVQDVTTSFEDAMPDARDALHDFTDAMEEQSVAEDRLGLISFNEVSVIDQDLAEMPDDVSLVHSAIDAMVNCENDPYATQLYFPCRGTNIAAGLDEAREQFLAHGSPSYAQKTIVLVSDGVPCMSGNFSASMALREEARRAAQDAEDAGITIHTVFLDQPIWTPSDGYIRCYPKRPETEDTSLMQELVTHQGLYFETAHEEDLDEILLSILQAMPIRVVR